MQINIKSNQKKVLVIGDLMVDSYYWGESNRISPEAPVPIVDISHSTKTLGGAGNVLKNLKAFGVGADIYSVIGDCDISNDILNLLDEAKYSTNFLVSEKGRKSPKKTRIISSHQQVIRFDVETKNDISNSSEKKIIDHLKKFIKSYSVVLLSDYGKGVLTHNLCQSIIAIASEYKIKVLIDPKGKDFKKYSGAYLLTPNLKEASDFLGKEIGNDKTILEGLKIIKEQCNLSESLITLSERGIALLDNELRIFPTQARDVFDVTGAGDTVIAALGFAFANDNNLHNSINFANLAASVVVGKLGSETASLEEIEKFANHSLKNIFHTSNLKELISKISKKEKIVFTNGCFDIIHSGHVNYLQKAKMLGNILIVGLNSDNSIKKIKGESRPIINEIDRAEVLSSLKMVDYVVIFDEETPYNLINSIQPDILVKGGDYTKEKIIGSNIVSDVRVIDYIKGKSTTEIINKIKKI